MRYEDFYWKAVFAKNVLIKSLINEETVPYLALESLLLRTEARRTIFPSMCGPQN
jgi:hypothetical protein